MRPNTTARTLGPVRSAPKEGAVGASDSGAVSREDVSERQRLRQQPEESDFHVGNQTEHLTQLQC